MAAVTTPPIVRRVEWGIAALLSLFVIFLLAVRAQHAGALWRDECAVVQLARMPTISDLLANFQRESFPAFFPLLIRGYAACFGTSDAAFRALGIIVGIILVLVCWIHSILLTKTPPLLVMALLGLNITFLVWGTSIRAYGLGSTMVLLAFSLIGKVLIEPTKGYIIAAALAAVASVQLLLFNSVLLLAIGLAVLIVCLIWRRMRPVFALAVVAAACLASVVPYVRPFRSESQNTVVFGGPVNLAWLWEQLALALGSPIRLLIPLWVGLFILSIMGALAFLYFKHSPASPADRDLLLYGLLTALISVTAYFAFLKILSYRTRDWYYLALIAIVAGAIDLIVAKLARGPIFRIARLALVLIAVAVIPVANWSKLVQRQTNLDLVAQKLEQMTQPRDLIVVNPWFFGVGFNWYYHGPTQWVTVPILDDHKVHRFDLLKAKLLAVKPIDDLIERITRTLDSGNQVWFVGGLTFLPADTPPMILPPAPNSEYGWSGDAYAISWSEQLGAFVNAHVTEGAVIPKPGSGPVNELENVSLLVARGWRE